LLTLAGCYSSAFTQTAQFGGQARDPSAVQVMSAAPASGYREVGIITANGSKFETALESARLEAGSHGCDVIVVLGEALESGRGVPGSAYGMTRDNLRCSCLVHTTEAVTRQP
jgi:hypothetical protein